MADQMAGRMAHSTADLLVATSAAMTVDYWAVQMAATTADMSDDGLAVPKAASSAATKVCWTAESMVVTTVVPTVATMADH